MWQPTTVWFSPAQTSFITVCRFSAASACTIGLKRLVKTCTAASPKRARAASSESPADAAGGCVKITVGTTRAAQRAPACCKNRRAASARPQAIATGVSSGCPVMSPIA